MATIRTPLTDQFNLNCPIMLAGMNVAAGPKLAAAVTNAGGLGVIGGVGYTPKMLRKNIQKLKKWLDDKSAPFGVDLLLPQVGGNARKTNYDYTHGTLPELIDIIIEEKAALFVSAVGVPPRWAVDKLHAAGIPCMNMIGAPKHVSKCLAAGVDMICAQGGEGGGHTGDVPTSILIPAVCDLVKGNLSPLTGKPVMVIAAGGIFDGRGLAMALALGAQGAWVGTRFICAEEAGAPKRHQKAVLTASYDDTVRTLIYTGRPLRVRKTPYIMNWQNERREEIKQLTQTGSIPFKHELETREKEGKEFTPEESLELMPLLMGQCAAAVSEVKPAKEIMSEMVAEAIAIIRSVNVGIVSKL